MGERHISNHYNSSLAILHYDPALPNSLAGAVILMTALKDTHNYVDVLAVPFREGEGVYLPEHPVPMDVPGAAPTYDLFFVGMLPTYDCMKELVVAQELGVNYPHIRSVTIWLKSHAVQTAAIVQLIKLEARFNIDIYASDADRTVEQDYTRQIHHRFASKLGTRNNHCKLLARSAGYGSFADRQDSMSTAAAQLNAGLVLGHAAKEKDVPELAEQLKAMREVPIVDGPKPKDLLMVMNGYGHVIWQLAFMEPEQLRQYTATQEE